MPEKANRKMEENTETRTILVIPGHLVDNKSGIPNQ